MLALKNRDKREQCWIQSFDVFSLFPFKARKQAYDAECMFCNILVSYVQESSEYRCGLLFAQQNEGASFYMYPASQWPRKSNQEGFGFAFLKKENVGMWLMHEVTTILVKIKLMSVLSFCVAGYLHCNGTMDGIMCWPAVRAGEIIRQPCPPLKALDTTSK